MTVSVTKRELLLASAGLAALPFLEPFAKLFGLFGSTDSIVHASSPQRWFARSPASSPLSLDDIISIAGRIPDFYEWWPAKHMPYLVNRDISGLIDDFVKEQEGYYGKAVSKTVDRYTPVRYLSFLKKPKPGGQLPQDVLELVNKAGMAFAHGSDYWKSKELPDIGFNLVVPNDKADLPGQQPEALPVLAVHEAGILYALDVVTNHEKGITVTGSLVYDNHPIRGLTFERTEVTGVDGNRTVSRRREFAAWPVNLTDKLAFTGPALLHLQDRLSALTLNHLKGEAAKQGVSEKEFYERHMIYKLMELLLAHGSIGTNWQEKIASDWNLAGVDSNYVLSTNPISQFSGFRTAVSRMTDKVKELGVPTAVRMYGSDPADLLRGVLNITRRDGS